LTGDVGFAFLLTLFAGLSTGIGGLIALLGKKTNTQFLAGALGFSAGVMIYVSFVEILPKGQESLTLAMGQPSGAWFTAAAFFGGMLLIGIIDFLIPEEANPHHTIPCPEDIEHSKRPPPEERSLARMGLMAAVAIAIHNFPEGLATFASALDDPRLGIAIALAIAIHNIPEGIAVAVPIFYATESKSRAFWYALLSGVAEPVGAVVGYALLTLLFTGPVLGVLFAGVAGIMVYISLDELLPAAREYGEDHVVIGGLVAGMMVMAISLLLLSGSSVAGAG